MGIMLIVGGFAICMALIIYSGSRLSIYGDMIAELTGMGKVWFGLIMMAAVTSLPELFNGISSILIVKVPQIAVGDIMGSCAFNLLILAVLDFMVPDKPLSSVVTKSHVLAGFISIILITHAIVAIVFGEQFPIFAWFKSFSVLLIILYLLSVRIIFKNERKIHFNSEIPILPHKIKNCTLRQATKRYAAFSLLVIIGAVALPFFANKLASEFGLNRSFVGTFFVGITTSLPELVVAIASVKIGSIDIAVGNLFGSNIFNMLILAIDDLLYREGNLLFEADLSHALSGLVTLVMTSVVGIGILYSSGSKRFALGIDAIILIVLYVSLIVALYNMG
ncbi:MAG: hypothetical protein ABI390_06970 [Daejeonella sp.]